MKEGRWKHTNLEKYKNRKAKNKKRTKKCNYEKAQDGFKFEICSLRLSNNFNYYEYETSATFTMCGNEYCYKQIQTEKRQ